jgi:hypothetical protein
VSLSCQLAVGKKCCETRHNNNSLTSFFPSLSLALSPRERNKTLLLITTTRKSVLTPRECELPLHFYLPFFRKFICVCLPLRSPTHNLFFLSFLSYSTAAPRTHERKQAESLVILERCCCCCSFETELCVESMYILLCDNMWSGISSERAKRENRESGRANREKEREREKPSCLREREKNIFENQQTSAFSKSCGCVYTLRSSLASHTTHYRCWLPHLSLLLDTESLMCLCDSLSLSLASVS